VLRKIIRKPTNKIIVALPKYYINSTTGEYTENLNSLNINDLSIL
jgi:hypothetical protein